METLREFEDLAVPRGTFPLQLVELIAREHASEVVRRFLRCHRVQLERHSRGIVDLLERWIARGGGDFSVWWNESLSQAGDTLHETGQATAVHRSVDLALHASGSGVPGAWSADVGVPRRYRWGRWLLPALHGISVDSDGAEAILIIKTRERDINVRLVRSASGWIADEHESLEPLVEVGTSHPPILLLPQAAAGEPLGAGVPVFEEVVSPEVAAAWRDAVAFLRRYAEVYESWVQWVVRQIGLIAVTPGIVHSGSYRNRYGFIHSSARASLISLAEVLVHEASHQYFYLLSCLGPVDDGSDSTQYYSPLVERKRPLDRILFAFHACANILNFYRLCMAHGVSEVDYCRRNEPIVIRQMEQLGVALRGNRALTSVGRTIYLPLVRD